MSDKRLQDKVAIVTGSTSGIGEAIAVLFAEHGAKVVVSGRSEERGRNVVEEITSAGNTAAFIRCDLSIDAECDALVAGAVERFGGIDVLVNNAVRGAADDVPADDVASLPPAEWDAQMAVSLRAVYYMAHLVIPHMKTGGGGTIVNISSVGGMVVWPGGAPYLTAKGGIHQLTKSIAIDYMADNIRANALAPGWVLTPPEQRRFDQDPELAKKWIDKMGIQRLASPREMAYPALFLACDESSYVTGSILLADGGWTLQ